MSTATRQKAARQARVLQTAKAAGRSPPPFDFSLLRPLTTTSSHQLPAGPVLGSDPISEALLCRFLPDFFSFS
jgi:hypothetical protein